MDPEPAKPAISFHRAPPEPREEERRSRGWIGLALAAAGAAAGGAAWLRYRKLEPEIDARTRRRLAPRPGRAI